MSTPVVTVAAGGIAVVDMGTGKFGLPVAEATNGRGIAVTKVVGKPGLPVVFDTTGAGAGFATLDPTTTANVTLSGGNLIITNTGTTSTDQGARVAPTSGKTSGKYYFEGTWTSLLAGGNNTIGIGTTNSTYSGMGGDGTTGDNLYQSGGVRSVGSLLSVGMGTWLTGHVTAIAADLDNRRIWFRKAPGAPSGTWNNSGTNDPATNVGGFVIPAGTMIPIVTFGGTSGVAGSIMTLNLGASAFVGAVPAGFTSGWPA
jgi:hypothetical protein